MRTDNVAQLQLVAEHPDRQYISAVIALVAFALLVPAVFGLAALLRPARPRLARAGGGLAIAGLVATACSTGLGLLEWQMVKGRLDRAQMVALLDQLESSGGMAGVFFAGALVSGGLLLLALALGITRRLPVVLAAGLALGPIGVDLGFTVNSLPVAIAGGTLMALGYAAVAAYLVRTADATRRTRAWSARPAPGLDG